MSQDRTGFIHNNMGPDDNLANPSGAPTANSITPIDLVPLVLPGRNMVNGHLEVAYHYRVRWTARNPAGTVQSQFIGLLSNAMSASTAAFSLTTPSMASIRPDLTGSLSASAIGQNYLGFGGIVATFPGMDSPQRTSTTPQTISLSTLGTDANGNPYSEGTTQFKVTLDISCASQGTAEAHDVMSLTQAKSLSIVRSENQKSPIGDDNKSVLPGLLEPDEYNADNSLGHGDSRYSNGVGGGLLGYNGPKRVSICSRLTGVLLW